MKNILISLAFCLLTSMSFADDIKIVSDPRTNSLIINAPGEIQKQIESLVKDLDVKRNLKLETKVIQLVYSDAVPMADILQSVMNSIKPLRIKSSQLNIERFYEPNDYGMVLPANNNKIIIISDKATISTMENIIKQLDVKKAHEFNTFVANVKNADVSKIAQIINNFNTRR